MSKRHRIKTPAHGDLEIYGFRVYAVVGHLPATRYNQDGATTDLLLAGHSMNDAAYSVQNPGAEVAMWFTAGAGSKAVLGENHNRDYCYYNGQFWRRLIRRDVGLKGRRSLAHRHQDGLHLYLQPQPRMNDQALGSLIMRELGSWIR